MKILLIGFNALYNSSRIILRNFDNSNVEILLLEHGIRKMNDQLEKISVDNYDYILILGDKRNSKSITLERIALNLFKNKYIKDGSPVAYETNLEIQEIYRLLKRNNVSTRISEHAGTHFCNYAFYYLMNKKISNVKIDLIHIPGYSKNIEYEELVDKIKIIIDYLRKNK